MPWLTWVHHETRREVTASSVAFRRVSESYDGLLPFPSSINPIPSIRYSVPSQEPAPDFVNSLVHGNFVYFFFRETAVEYINCGKAVFSRVARVCRDDRGGPHRFKQRWTSFLKSRLNCSVAGDFPFYFNEIQSTTELIEGVYGGLSAQLIYGTFTTPPNSISGSAVCAFSMQDIADTFEGTFKEQSAINSNWLPVNSAKVPNPRPGTCNNDSRQLPDQTLNFIKTHALMDESVPAFFGEPIVIRTSFHYRFTHIAVDPQVKTPGGKAYDVLFIGTDNGKIIKAINAASFDTNKRATPVVIEELQAFAAGSPVRALRVARAGRDAARLIAVSDRAVLSLRLHRCSSDKISSCSECVALQDPYCAWDKQAGRCRAYSHGVSRWLDENAFYQSVSTGSHAACPHSKDAGAVGGLSSGLYDDTRTEPKGEVINIVPNKDNANSANNEGPEVLAADPPPAAYSVETLALAVAAGALAALGAGFAAGYVCGRRCKKDDDDNMPYPDTEYEYFEQRQNINRIQAEPKLLQQVEEVTYAEPVLAPQPKPASPRATLRKHPPYHPHHETLFQFQPDSYRRDNFGTLRSHQVNIILARFADRDTRASRCVIIIRRYPSRHMPAGGRIPSRVAAQQRIGLGHGERRIVVVAVAAVVVAQPVGRAAAHAAAARAAALRLHLSQLARRPAARRLLPRALAHTTRPGARTPALLTL
ncbi:Semaphorin-1A [Eumeta japonica]|uniref:Semaphorin-1A n=1 Tax=Eumeta variegata TaxID=151549 RepID=A0A4C1TKK4_EUMVA|nr:Semaphorin-1A [Eumeta japonica]